MDRGSMCLFYSYGTSVLGHCQAIKPISLVCFLVAQLRQNAMISQAKPSTGLVPQYLLDATSDALG